MTTCRFDSGTEGRFMQNLLTKNLKSDQLYLMIFGESNSPQNFLTFNLNPSAT